jgi:hypothetical protein
VNSLVAHKGADNYFKNNSGLGSKTGAGYEPNIDFGPGSRTLDAIF